MKFSRRLKIALIPFRVHVGLLMQLILHPRRECRSLAYDIRQAGGLKLFIKEVIEDWRD